MFDFLTAGVELDSEGYQQGAEDAADAALDLGDASDEVASGGLLSINKAGLAAGGAVAGLGATMQSVLDDTQNLRESLGRTSASTELTSDEMNGLARSLSDASFPIEDSVATLDALAQQGIESEAELERLANASDNLADAVGSSAESIASDLGPAVRGLDGDLDALEENADTFTTAIRGTTLEADDLGRTLERSSEELDEMGVASDEAAQLVGAYAEETGKSGRQAQRDFASAVRDADGDIEELKDELGLTEEQVDAFSGELEENQGATEEHARAANDSLTAMDSLRAGFDRARLAVGDYLGPVSAAAPALQGLGVAAIAMSTINFGALAPSFAAVSAASLPVTGPLLAIGAGLGVIGGAVAAIAWEKDWIDPMETAGWAAERAGDGIDWLRERLLDGADAVRRFYPPIRIAREVYERNLFGIADIVDRVFGFIGDSIDWLIEKIDTIPGISIGEDDVDVDEDAIEEGGETGGDAAVRGLESPDYGGVGEQAGTSFGDGVEAGIAESFTLRDAEDLVEERLPELQAKMEEEGELWGEEAAEFAALQDAEDAIEDDGDITDLDADIVADLVEMQAENERAEEEFRDDVLAHLAPDTDAADTAPVPQAGETAFQAGGHELPDEPAPASGSDPATTGGSTGASRTEELDLSRETIRDLSEALAERVDGALLEVLLEVDDRELDRIIDDRVDAAITS